jgi:hypothetical protein
MKTLPQPQAWPCKACPKTVDVWDVELSLSGREIDPETTDVLCPDCLSAAAAVGEREVLQRWLTAHREMRRQIGDPPGTLVVLRDDVGDSNDLHSPAEKMNRFPSLLYGVLTDSWNASWPQTVLGEDFVVLGAVVTVRDVRPELVFRWSWQRPDMRAVCEIVGWDQPMTAREAERLMAGLGAFIRFLTPGPGKPRCRSKRSRDWYFDALRKYAKAIKREPTEEDFLKEYRIDRKTLKRNLDCYGLWPWEEFLRRGLSSSRSRTLSI